MRPANARSLGATEHSLPGCATDLPPIDPDPEDPPVGGYGTRGDMPAPALLAIAVLGRPRRRRPPPAR
jgi:hypothetical protein